MLYLRDIFGQDEAIRQIRQAWQAQRLPHGLIFAGPTGVGKGTTARALASWFLCEDPQADDACGRCNSCHLVGAGTHPDYHLIYRQLIRLTKKDSKARDLSIDVVREYLLEPASRKSTKGQGKVFVLEEAQTMTRDAANAILKTLEEPQGRTLIILLTDQPESLLPTIRSRCQTIRFSSLPDELIVSRLAEKGIDPRTAELAAHMAQGSLGLALQWAEDGIVARATPLHQRLSAIVAGRAVEDLPAFLSEAAKQQVEREQERDPGCSKDQAMREAVVLLTTLAADYLRSQLAADVDNAVRLRICRMIDDISQAQQYIRGNVNIDLVLEYLGTRLR